MSYGIEDNDRLYVDLMMTKQKDYLLSHGYNTMSANIEPHKYLSELNNRLSALVKVVKEDDCIPIFITITAPSQYHPSSKRYNNESIHSTTLYLSHIWKKLLNSNVFKRIKENDQKRHFFRTYEPHKTGVPHLHSLVYIPKKYVRDFKKAFIRLMLSQKIKQYKFLFQFKKAGYTSNFEGSKAYILKYILKSLKSAKDGTMTDVGYWYVKNNVRRISMSNSLVPLHMFRKIKYLDDYQDIYQVNIHYKNSRLVLSQKKTFIEIHYFNKEELIYDTKMLWKKPINQDKIREFINRKSMTLKSKDKPRITSKEISVYDGNNKYIGFVKDGVFTKDLFKYKSYDQYKDFQLYELVKTLENMLHSGEEINITKYAVFKEEAIKRNLINEFPTPIDQYNEIYSFIDVWLE